MMIALMITTCFAHMVVETKTFNKFDDSVVVGVTKLFLVKEVMGGGR